MTRHPIETLWREAGLPEYFLGNDGSNERLNALYDAIVKNPLGGFAGLSEDWHKLRGALRTIALIAEDSGTLNSLPHIAKIARGALSVDDNAIV